MASVYLQKYPIPQNLPEILHDFAKVILRDQPEDIIQYSADYFECLAQNKEFLGNSKFNVVKPEKANEHGKEYYEKSIKTSEPKHAPKGTAEKRKITKPETDPAPNQQRQPSVSGHKNTSSAGAKSGEPSRTVQEEAPVSKPQRPPSGKAGSRPGSQEARRLEESKDEGRPGSKYSGRSSGTEQTHRTEKELGNDYLNELGDFAIEKVGRLFRGFNC
jgi:Regulatory subunit of type II PKA R-subunit